jgi:hypothetical protein
MVIFKYSSMIKHEGMNTVKHNLLTEYLNGCSYTDILKIITLLKMAFLTRLWKLIPPHPISQIKFQFYKEIRHFPAFTPHLNSPAMHLLI